jgi:uncharacterized protein (TIGR02145 family)
MKIIRCFLNFNFLLSSLILILTIGCKGTVKDIEGNVYHSVKIGTQVWMKENLKTTKYRNGDPINNVMDKSDWSELSTGAYCNYDGDVATSNKYGKLYNWYAVNTSNLAPKGWHVPTDAEWTILENYLIANGFNYDGSITGDRESNNNIAKSIASTTDWSSVSDSGEVGFDITKNNTSGFSALPGGFRGSSGSFDEIGKSGYWWTSSEKHSLRYSSSSRPIGRTIHYNWRDVNSIDCEKIVGLSVRCIKD